MDERYYDNKLGFTDNTRGDERRAQVNDYSDVFSRPNDTNAFVEQPKHFRSENQSRNRFARWFQSEEERAPERPQRAPGAQPSANQNNGNIVIYSPTTYEDVQTLIDHLKHGEQVIVDFSNVNQAAVYRILDFMSGAIYALSGSIQQITRNIFLFAPAGVTISVPPQLRK